MARQHKLLRDLERSGRTQVLTVDGKPKAVLLNVKVYERLVKEVEKAETQEGIRRGIADMEAGRTVTLSDAKAELLKRLRARRRKGSRSA